MIILGLNAFHADAAAALLVDGQLVAAVEEERLSRVKHAAGFPSLAARRCLEMAGILPSQIDHVAISRDPGANAVRKLGAVLTGRAPASMVLGRLRNAAAISTVKDHLQLALGDVRAQFHDIEHHRAHLASAFFSSPWPDAAVLSLDGFGDFVSTMWGFGHHDTVDVRGAVRFPHSLGVLYTAVTQWLGFPHYGDEGKVMGLAPYGERRLVSRLRKALWPTVDGFQLDPTFFSHATTGLSMTWESGSPRISTLYTSRLTEELGAARSPDAPLLAYHLDVAASLQALTEEIVFHVARLAHRATGSSRLCLAGGVALNSVANGKLRAHTPFDEIFVQPAAGDNGTALGAAQWVAHAVLGHKRRMQVTTPAWGPAFTSADCKAALARVDISGLRVTELDEEALCARAASCIADGKVVGWFQGRMEFGPRALGQRSVLCDPRRAEMKDILNRRIKRRESFRPFAPSVLAESAADWFLDTQPSPAMLLVLPIRPDKQAQVPAVAHVDGSGRLQTVSAADQPLYHRLISAFFALTGVPMVLNTSFNENEPIVCTPDEALACFLRTDMDALFLGPLALERV